MSERRPIAFSDALVERALSREPDSGAAAQTLERILADIADRPQRRPGLRHVVISTVTSRPRVALGWVALVALLVGVLLAVAALAGGPKPRPVLGVVSTTAPTTAPTTQPTSIPTTTEPAATLAGDCGTLLPDAVRATSPGGSLAAAAPRPLGLPSNGLIAYVTASGIVTYDPTTGARAQVATLHPTGAQPTPGLDVGELTWSPDGRRLAFVSGTDEFWCNLTVANADGSGLALLARLGLDKRDDLETVVWSPDGSSVVYNQGHELVVATIGGSSRPLPGTNNCWKPAWSPDGSRIACIGDAAIITVATGKSVGLNINPNGFSNWPDSPVWAADSQSISLLGEGGLDPATAYRIGADGTILSSIGLSGSSDWLPERDLSPDGSRVLAKPCPVAPCGEAEFRVVPIDGSPATSLGRGLTGMWSDDGSKVAIANADGIFVADAKDGTTQVIVRAAFAQVVSWSPDQRQLLYSLPNGQLWTVATTGGGTTLVDEGPVSTGSGGVAWQPRWP
jgi:Tol biopolymer transport system component